MKRRFDEWDGARVSALRERLQITQEELSVRLGVRMETVNRWENGHTKPTGLSKRALEALERETSW
jgi:DNA-binding transcriptional regulator YiaG